MSAPAYFDLPACLKCGALALFPFHEAEVEEDFAEEDRGPPAGWECCVCLATTWGAADRRAHMTRGLKFIRALDAWKDARPPHASPCMDGLREQVKARAQREQARLRSIQEGRW